MEENTFKFVVARAASDVISATEVSVAQSQPAFADEVEIEQDREEAPHVTTCLVDSEVDVGTAVTLMATVQGKCMHVNVERW